MPTPAKLEKALSPAEVARFCARLAATPGGTALRVIIAEARQHGVILNTHSAATVRDGPLAAALAGLHTASAQAASVDAVAHDGRDLAGAAAALLVQRLFAKLQGGAELTPRELEQFSRVLGRLQSGISRNRKLEFELRVLQDRLAHREAELKFDREKSGQKARPGLAGAVERLRDKCGYNKVALYKLEDALVLLFRYRPDDPELTPLKKAAAVWWSKPRMVLADTQENKDAANKRLEEECQRARSAHAQAWQTAPPASAPGSPPPAPG